MSGAITEALVGRISGALIVGMGAISEAMVGRFSGDLVAGIGAITGAMISATTGALVFRFDAITGVLIVVLGALRLGLGALGLTLRLDDELGEIVLASIWSERRRRREKEIWRELEKAIEFEIDCVVFRLEHERMKGNGDIA